MQERHSALRRIINLYPQQDRALVGGCLASYGLHVLLQHHRLDYILSDAQCVVEATDSANQELSSIINSHFQARTSRPDVVSKFPFTDGGTVDQVIVGANATATPFHLLAKREIRRLTREAFNEFKSSAHGIRLHDLDDAFKSLFPENTYSYMGGIHLIRKLVNEYLPESIRLVLQDASDLGDHSEAPSYATFGMNIGDSTNPIKVSVKDAAIGFEKWTKMVSHVVRKLWAMEGQTQNELEQPPIPKVEIRKESEEYFEKRKYQREYLPPKVPKPQSSLGSHIASIRKNEAAVKKAALKMSAQHRLDAFEQGDKEAIKRSGRGAMALDIANCFLKSKIIQKIAAADINYPEARENHDEMLASESLNSETLQSCAYSVPSDFEDSSEQIEREERPNYSGWVGTF